MPCYALLRTAIISLPLGVVRNVENNIRFAVAGLVLIAFLF